MGYDDDPVTAAAHAHTNLNTFASVVKLLEGGLLYGPHAEAAEIIRIANRAQARLLRAYDCARAEAGRQALRGDGA